MRAIMHWLAGDEGSSATVYVQVAVEFPACTTTDVWMTERIERLFFERLFFGGKIARYGH